MIPEVNKPNGDGLKRILNATRCSIKGMRDAWQFESAFRQELLLVCVLLPFTFVLSQSSIHWLILVFSLIFLLFAELVNSSIEAIADAVTLEHHPLIGRSKDMGSAVVFMSLLFLGCVWGHAIAVYAGWMVF